MTKLFVHYYLTYYGNAYIGSERHTVYQSEKKKIPITVYRQIFAPILFLPKSLQITSVLTQLYLGNFKMEQKCLQVYNGEKHARQKITLYKRYLII